MLCSSYVGAFISLAISGAGTTKHPALAGVIVRDVPACQPAMLRNR